MAQRILTDSTTITWDESVSGIVKGNVTANKLGVSVLDFGAVGDGITDDSAAINAAIVSGEPSIYFPNLIFGINSGISTNYGGGPNLIWGPGTIKAIGPHNNQIINLGGLIDAVIFGLTFDFDPAIYGGANAQTMLFLNYCLNTIVLKCHIVNGAYNAATVEASVNSGFKECVVENFTHTGISLTDTDPSSPSSRNFAILNSVFANGTQNGHTIEAIKGTDIDIIGNYISRSGIVGSFGISSQSGIRHRVKFNRVEDSTSEAIEVGGFGGNGESIDCEIVGNHCTWPNIASGDFGISSSSDSSGNKVVRLRIANNFVRGSYASGIAFAGNVEHSQILDNFVYNPGEEGAGGTSPTFRAGVQMYSSGTNDNVSKGNILISDDGMMTYGFRESSDGGSPLRNTSWDDLSIGFATSDYVIVGTGSNVYRPTLVASV